MRIFLNCCAFDKLLDATIDRGSYGGFQLDVSYLTSDDMSRDKQFIILIKSERDYVDDCDVNFLKIESVRVSNMIEYFYIFYIEIKPPRELRDYKIDQINSDGVNI